MTSTKLLSHALLLFLIAVVGVGSARATGSSQQPASDIAGTWSGTFQSDHSNVAPFTMTVVINRDAHGHLVGASNLVSECVRGVSLQVTVTGTKVVLAGSDADGDSITLRGTMDSSGTLLNLRYIVNGSASGRCETDQGSGTLGKR